MKPYVISNFKSDLREVVSAKLIVPSGNTVQCVELPGTEITLNPQAESVYNCGTLTGLTITDYPTRGSFAVSFTSGAVPTVLIVLQALVMPKDYSIQANTRYELNVQDGYAPVAGWEIRDE